MKDIIYKYERDILGEENIHVRRKTDGSWSRKHWHNYYEIIYFKGCRGECQLNGERYDLTDRCLFFMTPKDFHRVQTVSGGMGEAYIVSFGEQMTDPRLLASITENPIAISTADARLSDNIEELYTVFSGNSELRAESLYHILNCALVRITREGTAVRSVPSDINPIVRRSIHLMLNNPGADFSLDYFAREFDVTATYFSHLFSDSMGVSFKKYLTSLRLECSRRMLDGDELSVIDIGYECGFNTPSQFVRSFKAKYGVPPSVYRSTRR